MAAAGEIRAAGLLVFRVVGDFQYLLLQAADGIHHWTPPKGHVEPGEELQTAAIRETAEEAGLLSSHYYIFDEFPLEIEYTARGKPKKVDYWLAQLKDASTPIQLSHEHQDYKWVNATEAIKMSHSNMTNIILKAEKFLQEKFPQVPKSEEP